MSGKALNILLLGGGGREHALAWKMTQSAEAAAIYAMPGNDGMAALHKVSCISGDIGNADFIVETAKSLKIDLVVVGPEKPLEAGATDKLEAAGIPVMGPSKAAAQLESSKIFAKNFMRGVNIPTANFTVCDSHEDAIAALSGWDIEGKGIVIKADGLSAGKGVVVTNDRKEAVQTLFDFMVNPTCSVKSARILLEEKISGKEVSAFALCDGKNFTTLGFVCDYKRIRDGDEGPNTGGMGGYAPKGWPSAAARSFVEKKIFQALLDGMAKNGTPFRGILFAGLMVDGEDVQVIEFNTRFGDPETQILMPLIDGDIVPLFLKASKGELAAADKVTLRDVSAVHVVMVSEGYPETFGTGMVLGQKIDLEESLLQHGLNDNDLLFVMGAKKQGAGWTNEGGRVLGITSLGKSMDEARSRAYAAISAIRFNGAHWRNDIGK